MLPPLTTLLAETHMAEVSLKYRETATTSGVSQWWYLLIPVAAIALAVAIYHLFNRPPAIVNTPLGMLHELCRCHRIRGAGRILLEQISEAAQLEHPATLFLGAAQFDSAVAKAGQRIAYDRKQTQLLAILRRRMFA